MARRPVNALQLGVLRWIADGCPHGTMDGQGHKVVAVALLSRGLATVSRRGGIWRAALALDGQHFLTNGTYPDAKREAPLPRPKWTLVAEQGPSTSGSAPSTRAQRATPPDGPMVAVSVTEALVAAVVAAGGALPVDRCSTHPTYTALIHVANRRGKTPPGTYLRSGSIGRQSIVELVEAAPWITRTPMALPIPDSLRSPHPVVKELQSDASALTVAPRSVRQRALRIIQALAVEADRRGHSAVVPPDAKGYHRPGAPRCLFTLNSRGHSVAVNMTQQTARSEHQQTATELKLAVRRSYSVAPRWDYEPLDLFRLELTTLPEQIQSTWVESATSRLEEVLHRVMYEVELRIAAAEAAAERAEHERQRRRLLWEQAMQTAKHRYIEAYRARVLEEQREAWSHANQLNSYLDALRVAVEALPDHTTEAGQEWLRWAQQYAISSNPLRGRLAMPDVPEPHQQDLAPYLGGWSSYGP